MNQISKDSKFGFIFKITDEERARYAMKMSGLSALVLGINFLLFAFIKASTVISANYDWSWVIGSSAIGVILVVIGFLIRAGKSALVPVTSLICALTFGATIALGQGVQFFVSAMCLGLSIAGLQGWIWIRKHS